MFKKGHHHKKNTVIFMKTRQKPIVEKPEARKGQEVSPTTTLMHRGTLGGSGVFSNGKGIIEGPSKQENKGAQKGKTPLSLWDRGPTQADGC